MQTARPEQKRAAEPQFRRPHAPARDSAPLYRLTWLVGVVEVTFFLNSGDTSRVPRSR